MAADLQLLLGALPIAAAALARQRHVDQLPENERWWLDFRAAVPAPVWQYVGSAAISGRRSRRTGSIRTPGSRPTTRDLENVIEGAHHAFRHELEAPLSRPGRSAQVGRVASGLGARPRTGRRLTAARYDDFIGEQAAQMLLGWTRRESLAAWLEPEQFLDRWRVAGTTDTDSLARAGLARRRVDVARGRYIFFFFF